MPSDITDYIASLNCDYDFKTVTIRNSQASANKLHCKSITFIIFISSGSHTNDFEHLLMRDLFKGYNKESRPVFNKSTAVNVQLDVAYSQLVELVRAF